MNDFNKLVLGVNSKIINNPVFCNLLLSFLKENYGYKGKITTNVDEKSFTINFPVMKDDKAVIPSTIVKKIVFGLDGDKLVVDEYYDMVYDYKKYMLTGYVDVANIDGNASVLCSSYKHHIYSKDGIEEFVGYFNRENYILNGYKYNEVANIVELLDKKGLFKPLVWNSNGTVVFPMCIDTCSYKMYLRNLDSMGLAKIVEGKANSKDKVSDSDKETIYYAFVRPNDPEKLRIDLSNVYAVDNFGVLSKSKGYNEESIQEIEDKIVSGYPNLITKSNLAKKKDKDSLVMMRALLDNTLKAKKEVLAKRRRHL